MSVLLASEILFLLRVPAEKNAMACKIVAVLTHYSFLAGYFWSVLFAFEIIQTVRSMYAVNQKSKKKLVK